ncbi:metalloregulator ArsR/SmtB family transcription factor [Salinibacterium sp. G-O1]|uniref:ArsR/SmtB family transcription factor n=1 Tax=Salinibacterium sp. G-O1 TaxID=3046208 RepID=UPI0024BAF571|nr:metalloregulator ArsR/SmtB family transcription factor [Salinibacterium sp. G-O1]MDJ0334093.1 metalloregulator ArsR/SmtB family transcription factor [Salinibacterium sp. G-O1]
MDEIFHALSDPHRRQIVDRLSEGPASVTQLAGLLPIARPGVSRHLRVLRAAGLVTVDADAQFRIYSLDLAPLAALEEWLQVRRGLWTQRLDALQTEVARGKRNRAIAGEVKSREAS